MCSQFMQQSMRSMTRLIGSMLHMRDVKRKLQKRKINTLIENPNSQVPNNKRGIPHSLRKAKASLIQEDLDQDAKTNATGAYVYT